MAEEYHIGLVRRALELANCLQYENAEVLFRLGIQGDEESPAVLKKAQFNMSRYMLDSIVKRILTNSVKMLIS